MNSFTTLPIEKFATPVFGRIDRATEGDKPSRICYGGTTWFARPFASHCTPTFVKGEQVTIFARQGNTLLIMPTVNQSRQQAAPSHR